jgi:hypothetical protein
MSIIRQKLGASMTNSALNAARSSNELTNIWLRRLNSTSTTGEAKEAHSQLQSVLDFYNKQTTGITKQIDWEDYRERIHTPNVVDKIKAKYDKFLESQYSVDSAVSKCGTSSDKMQALDISLQYNFMLYFVHYSSHLETLETIRNIGDITQLSVQELIKLMPEAETLTAIK